MKQLAFSFHRLAAASKRASLSMLLALAAVCIPCGGARAGITIGPGADVGSDLAFPPNVFKEEFQDWKADMVRALDGVGTGAGSRYNFNDGFDDSRDLAAFYSSYEPNAGNPGQGNYFFRLDVFDLKSGAESGNLNFYVAIDCAPGGQDFMPDFTNVKVSPSSQWELCLCVYGQGTNAGTNYRMYDKNFAEVSGGYLGSYWNNDLDSIEFGVSEAILRANGGWNPTSTPTLRFTVMTTKGNTQIFDGPRQASSATDVFNDDNRGFFPPGGQTIGVLSDASAIASNATTGRAKWASIAHGNQSVNQNDDTRVHIFDPTNAYKTGFLRTLDTHRIFRVPINLHLSGSLIMAANWAKADPAGDPATTETPLSDGPSFLAEVKKFVDNDQSDRPGALVGGVVAEHIMPYFEGPVNQESLTRFDDITSAAFGITARDMLVMHTPERVLRNSPTNLSPLNGFTFADIQNSGYKATYIDEVTHYHWWFDRTETRWSGNGGSYDAPVQHKIHNIAGVLCFLINDREDQQKFGNHDNGATLDTRYTFVDHALSADQQQIIVVFDDWEALAGKSFDPVNGSPVANNNQTQYQNTVRWIANHPWIEVVTLKDVLARATDNSNPQYSSNWVVNHSASEVANLDIQTYEWLKHASEGSYHYWYYNNNAGFAGNEQSFYNLVPVISGPQGDYRSRGHSISSDAAARAVDGPQLPSGMIHGDMNSPGTLMHDTWAAIEAAPRNNARTLASWLFINMIYETAWHEEDNGNYANTVYQNPFPFPDTSWDGVNTWALRLQNHVRKARILTEAAHWVEDVRTGAIGATPVITNTDLDFDGQNEPVLKNNRVFAAFESFGGVCTYAFAFDPARGDAYLVVGAAVANPTAPGEEEGNGQNANKCSAFKDMNSYGGGALADQQYQATVLSDGVRFSYVNGGNTIITKTFRLAAGDNRIRATYQTSGVGGPLYTRIGASPNNRDLMLHGVANLSQYAAGSVRGVVNSRGGSVFVHQGASSSFNTASLLYGGYLNRNLALTEQLEVFGADNSTYSFDLELGIGGSPTSASEPTPTPTATPSATATPTATSSGPTATPTVSPTPSVSPTPFVLRDLPLLTAPPTLDGTVNDAEYTAGSTVVTIAADTAKNSFGDSNKIGTIYLANDANYLYIGIKGLKLSGQPNAFVLYLDTTQGAATNLGYGIIGTEQLDDYGAQPSAGVANAQEALSVALNQTTWPGGAPGNVHFSPSGVSFTAEFGIAITGSTNQSLAADAYPTDAGTIGLFGFPYPGSTGKLTDMAFLRAQFAGGASQDMEIRIAFSELQLTLPNNAAHGENPFGPSLAQREFGLVGFIVNGDTGDVSDQFIPSQAHISGVTTNNGSNALTVDWTSGHFRLAAVSAPTGTASPTPSATPSATVTATAEITETPTVSPTASPTAVPPRQLPLLSTAPTLDGTVNASEYTGSASPVTVAADPAKDAFGANNQIGTVYLANDANNLYIGLKGFKLEGQPNSFVLFLDTSQGALGNEAFGIPGTEMLADYGPQPSAGFANAQEAISVGLNRTSWPGGPPGRVHFGLNTNGSFTAEYAISITGSQNQSLAVDVFPADDGAIGLFGFPYLGSLSPTNDFAFLHAQFVGGSTQDMEIRIPFSTFAVALNGNQPQGANPFSPSTAQRRFALLGYILNGDTGDLSDQFIPQQADITGVTTNDGTRHVMVDFANAQFELAPATPATATPTATASASPSASPTPSATASPSASPSVTASVTATPTPTPRDIPFVTTAPTLDGTVNASEYTAASVVATLAADAAKDSFGPNNRIGTIYLANDANNLYIGLKGFKLEGQPNALTLFLDTSHGATSNELFGIAGTEQLADYGPQPSAGFANAQEALSVALNQTTWDGGIATSNVHFSLSGRTFTADYGISIAGSQNQSLSADVFPDDAGAIGLFGFPFPGINTTIDNFYFLHAQFVGGATQDMEIRIPFSTFDEQIPANITQNANPFGPTREQRAFALVGFILNGDTGDLSDQFVPQQPGITGVTMNDGTKTILLDWAGGVFRLGQQPTPTPTATASVTATPSSTAGPTQTATATPTASPSPSASPTLTASPTAVGPSVDTDGDGYSDVYETSVGSNPSDPSDRPALADVDNDGRQTLEDAIVMYRAIRSGDTQGLNLSDFNGDGRTDAADAIYLYRWLLGLPGYEILK